MLGTSTTFQSKNLKARGPFVDLDVDGIIILKWIFTKWDLRVWTVDFLKIVSSGALS
jgi:hypothetical protein